MAQKPYSKEIALKSYFFLSKRDLLKIISIFVQIVAILLGASKAER
jgi:hypothetical protein